MWLTSFVPSRAHYVSYIFLKSEFHLHDGLPLDKPVLRTYSSKLIDGDVSHLIYIPLDDTLNNKSPSLSTTIIIFLMEKVERVQYQAALAITGACQSSSCSKNLR